MNLLNIDAEQEEFLVKNATIVFDTSSIGQLYYLTEETKKTMVDILSCLKDRLWMPAQVFLEYSKNREKLLRNPADEQYSTPKFSQNQLVDDLQVFVKKHRDNPYFHPHFDDTQLADIETETNKIKESYKQIKAIVKEQNKKRREEIESMIHDYSRDVLWQVFSSVTKGVPFTYPEVMEIVREGRFRYENSIPPGYKDGENDKKKGFQVYGDLIVWKEILRYAKKEKKPVLFICDDMKEDLYRDAKKFLPRYELIKEFTDITQQQCWIIPLGRFLALLELYIKDNTILPFYNGLEAVKDALNTKERLKQIHQNPTTEVIIVKCAHCGEVFTVEGEDFFYDWEVEGFSEREMGTEIEHTSYELVSCPQCDSDIEVELKVWEYPEGQYEAEDIECEEGKILENHLSLRDHITLIEEKEQCQRCGAWTKVGEDGLCESCSDYYAYCVD